MERSIAIITVAVILTVLLAYVGLSLRIARLGEWVARVDGIIEGWPNHPLGPEGGPRVSLFDTEHSPIPTQLS